MYQKLKAAGDLKEILRIWFYRAIKQVLALAQLLIVNINTELSGNPEGLINIAYQTPHTNQILVFQHKSPEANPKSLFFLRYDKFALYCAKF